MATHTRKNLTKAQRRDSIVAAARQVFATSGLNARVREIAERAGINEALIYQHFASKDDLVAAAVVAPLERVMRELDSTVVALPEGSDAAQRAATAAFMRRFLEAFTEAAPLFGLIMFSDAKTGGEFYTQHLVPVIDQAIHNIRANLGSWSHREFDPAITAPAGVGMCFWLAIDAHFRGTTLDIEAATNQLTDVLFDGVALPR